MNVMNVTKTKVMWHHPAPVNLLINWQDVEIVESSNIFCILIWQQQHRYADQEKASSAFSVWGSWPSFRQIPDDSVLYIIYWARFHLFLSLPFGISPPLIEKTHWQGQQKSAVIGIHKNKKKPLSEVYNKQLSDRAESIMSDSTYPVH